MSDQARIFHEQWLGMVQPSEGLVVSVPVLVDAQCMEKQGREIQEKLLACTARDNAGRRYVPNLSQLFADVLGLEPERFHTADELPRDLRLYVLEGRQELRPTLALKRRTTPSGKAGESVLPPAAEAGQAYVALLWDVPSEIDLDKPETVTGSWEYPAQAKFDRLLRECRVPIGILTNGREVRLTYAPHGESSGWLSFRIEPMCEVGGRPILDAFVMLLCQARWFGVAEDVQLPALLEQSRGKQGEVTNALAGQLFDALEELLAGFSAASERDQLDLLRRALDEGEEGYLYSGLLTVLLRLVFALYCEDRGLLPVESELFERNYSVFALYEQLEKDNGRFPDSMDRRFGAYPRLVSLFRAMYLGVSHGDLNLPPRHGGLFDPNRYPFIEGWAGGSAPITDPVARAKVDIPSVSDGTIYRVLKQLIVLNGQRLSYRALDVEQLGSVYEALMGFDVARLQGGAVRIKLANKRNSASIWLEAKTLLSTPATRRTGWLQDELGFDKGLAEKVAQAVKDAKTEDAALLALEPLCGRNRERAKPGAYVIQPGPERRRTSSHYTPRSLSEPIVQKTLDPLLKAMGERPSSEALLRLKICDPAMGSGAFLVAACRYLADQVVAAWTREAAEETGSLKGIGPTPAGGYKTKLELLGDAHEDVVNHARRLVAQRCLYGVDKNKYAVQLARLSLWLITMAKNEPFTFVDHALRYGDSLVGLDFDQIRAFNWKAGHKGEQVEVTSLALRQALDEAIGIRQQILELAADPSPWAQREKERLLTDAEDATGRVRLIADLVVGAFFAEEKDKDREKERVRRLDLVQRWLGATDLSAEQELEEELRELQRELKKTQVPFHWHLEFPEVFYLERPDPLEGGKVNKRAMMDAFVGNPPFMGKNGISALCGASYLPWLVQSFEPAHGNADLSAYFFRQTAELLGSHGTIGLIATNTIAQGDTRATSLQPLCTNGFAIYDTRTNEQWPGAAAVTVTIVHLAKGKPANDVQCALNGKFAPAISSRLKPTPERADPIPLPANRGISFLGLNPWGLGFVLDAEEGEKLLHADARNAEKLKPFVGGQDLNSEPVPGEQVLRYAIHFGADSLEEAAKWPELLAIVRERVKPGRDLLGDNTDARRMKQYWWQYYGRDRPEMTSALLSIDRVLATSRVNKHLVFAFHRPNVLFSEGVCLITLPQWSSFALVQSRVHELWARLLSSTMRDAGIRYAATDCFETFPFPKPDPRTVIPELEAIGEKLYEARAKYMVDTDQGLTKTYNALKDPNCTDKRILELRKLHEEMDRAVLRAYPKLPGVGCDDTNQKGWEDIKVPPFCIATEEDKVALQAFEDEVIDRLFVLNEIRAKEEAALGRGAKQKAAPKAAPKAAAAPKPSETKKAKKAPKKTTKNQGELF